MSETRTRGLSRRVPLLLALFAVLMVAVFAWSKWLPYAAKVPAVADAGRMSGQPVIDDTSRPWFSLSQGWDFTGSYLTSVWPALVAGLLAAAAVQTLLPTPLLRRFVDGDGGWAGTARAAAAGVPTMLCACCAAPMAVGLRRRQVSQRSALAFWLANPLLNPAVMAFAFFALSPGWMMLRLAAGAAVMALVLLAVSRSEADTDAVAAPPPETTGSDGMGLRAFARSLLQLCLTILPAFLVTVFLLGSVQGALFPVGDRLAGWGIAGVLLLAVTGMLLAVPTGAEVAVVAALTAAGLPAWLVAPLLITLPATSLPSLLMARRAFPWRVEAWVAGSTVLVGLLAAAVVRLMPLG